MIHSVTMNRSTRGARSQTWTYINCRRQLRQHQQSTRSRRSNPFNRLPSELIERILVYSLNDLQPVKIHPLLLVCRAVYRHARVLLWTNIVLNEYSLCRFATLSRYNSNFSLIQNLTIAPDAYKITACHPAHQFVPCTHMARFFMRRLSYGLFQLKSRLPFMGNLKTFSLNFGTAPVPWKGTEIWINASTIQSLLQSMPDSLQNLELDTQGYDRSAHYEKTLCSCESISKLLPQLKHLKLSLGSICPKVLRASSTIESIIINITAGLKCMTVPCGTMYDRYITAMDKDESYSCGYLTRINLLRTGTRLTQSAKLPQLNHFQIIDMDASNGFYSTVYLKHDLLNQTTTSYPILGLTSLKWEMEHFKILVRVKNGTINQPVDLLAYVPDVVSYLSGHPWVEEIRGLRHPASGRTPALLKTLTWNPPVEPNWLIKWRPGEPYTLPFHRMEIRTCRTLARPRVGAIGIVSDCLDLRRSVMQDLSRMEPHEQYQFGISLRKQRDDNAAAAARESGVYRDPFAWKNNFDDDSKSDFTDGFLSDLELELEESDPDTDDALGDCGSDVTDES